MTDIKQQCAEISIYAYYYFIANINDISNFKPQNIILSDDMLSDAIKLGGGEKDIVNAQAVTVHPNNVTNEFYVLIDFNTITDPLNLAEILMHEFIHVYDYLQLGKEYFDGDISSLDSYPYWEFFQLTSEFVAYSYAQQYAVQFCDQIYRTNNYEVAISHYVQNFAEYFNNKTNEIQEENRISRADIFMILGKLHMLDICNNNNKRSMYEYIPKLFSSQRQQQLTYQIFDLCLQLNDSNNRLLLLPSLLDLIYQF